MFSGSWTFSTRGVAVPPGATALTRIPCFMYSMASDRVSCTRAPLLEQ